MAARYRILFDYFFFKRFDEDDEPFVVLLTYDDEKNTVSIDRGKKEDPVKEKSIRRILNLQLLFNFTGDFYAQHWIQSALRWLDEKADGYRKNDFYKSYAEFLEDFDREIMCTRLSDNDLQKNI